MVWAEIEDVLRADRFEEFAHECVALQTRRRVEVGIEVLTTVTLCRKLLIPLSVAPHGLWQATLVLSAIRQDATSTSLSTYRHCASVSTALSDATSVPVPRALPDGTPCRCPAATLPPLPCHRCQRLLPGTMLRSSVRPCSASTLEYISCMVPRRSGSASIARATMPRQFMRLWDLPAPPPVGGANAASSFISLL